jgi:glycosyltransferase involved in cell wall biosynthesis
MTKSLTEMILAFPAGAVEAVILCPRGQSAEIFRAAGFKVVEAYGIARWNESRHGYYRGLRWLVLLRELVFLPFTLLALRRALAEGPYDLIHSNEVDTTYLGLLTKRLTGVPLVAHVRCLLRGPGGSRRTRHQEAALAAADQVIAIDGNVRRTLPPDLPVEIVHNGMTVKGATIQELRDGGTVRVAAIGTLNATKGIYQFLDAARRCRAARLDVEFWLVGGNVRQVAGPIGWLMRQLGLENDVRADLERIIQAEGLASRVLLKGVVKDVSAIYRQIDIVSFVTPLDAPGRPVFEAAYFGIPSVVAVRDPTPDTIVPGETGICIPMPDPKLLADAVEYLYRNPAERRRMGENARVLAQANFDIRRNAARVLDIYRRLAGSRF